MLGFPLAVGLLRSRTVGAAEGSGLGRRSNFSGSLWTLVGVGRVRSSAVSAGGSGAFASNVGGVGFCAGGALGGKSAGRGGVSKRHAAAALEGLGTGRLGGFASVVTQEEGESVSKEVVDGGAGFCGYSEHRSGRTGGAALDTPSGERLQVLDSEGI